jgi:protein FRA10AC1
MQFSLRWRTEAEVLAGAGETTCGNTRCEHHEGRPPPPLTTLELPFAYTEHGEAKSALVKAVLFEKCLKKLMWKRRKEKERLLADAGPAVKEEETEPDLAGLGRRDRAEEGLREEGQSREERRYRKRHSRSRSPRRRDKDGERIRRRSPIR